MKDNHSDTKRRILVLTPRLPYPPIGGDRLRIYQICRYLSRHFDLSLLSMCESEAEMEAPVPDDGVFTSVERVFHPRNKRVAGVIAAVPSRVPLQVGYFRNREFSDRLSELAPLHDALFAHLIRTASYITDYQIPKIVEMTDAISLSYARAVGHARLLSSAAYAIEASRLRSYEKAIVRKCDLAVFVSDVDRNFLFPAAVDPKIIVCSNGVETKNFPYQFAPDGRTIIFIGKNMARYNVDGIRYFSEEILPIVRSRQPKAQFKVIGQIRPRFKARLERRGIIVTGEVDSIASAARHATVAVCPLRIGAGVQNKILEYMALGVPTIASTIGLEGLDATPGVHLLTAGSPLDWADKICNLLEDREGAAAMSAAARRFVESRHSWPTLISRLSDTIRDLLN